MTDRRVTLVMTEAERDAIAAAIEDATPHSSDDWRILKAHLDRLRNARVASWGRRGS